MRSFIISVILLLVLMGGWFGFDIYSENELNGYIDTIEKEIIPYIEEENLQAAASSFDALRSDWHDYRKYAEFFLGTNELNEIDYTMTKSMSYMENADASSASGELAYLKTQMRFLDLNENINAGNIF